MAKKSTWQKSTMEQKNSIMIKALKEAAPKAGSVDNLKQIAFENMKKAGLFEGTDDGEFQNFNRRNPYFDTLAKDVFSAGKTNTTAQATGETSQESTEWSKPVEIAGQQVSKTTIAIVIGLVIIIGVTLFFVLKN